MKLEATVEELRKYSLFVGVPMYGGNCSGIFCKSTNDLAVLCARYGIELKFYYLFNESLVQRARNYITDEFMRSTCSHLMFIDADIGFDPNYVLALLALQTSNSDKLDIVSAPYPKKTIAWEKIRSAVKEGKADKNPSDLEYYYGDYAFNTISGTTQFKINEPLEVSEAGTGFMLIPRATLNKYKQTYPEFQYTPDHVRSQQFDGGRKIMAYFDTGIDPETNRYLSEDYFFCSKARQAGLKIHTCPWMTLQHVGSYVFKGSLAALSTLESPTITAEIDTKKKY